MPPDAPPLSPCSLQELSALAERGVILPAPHLVAVMRDVPPGAIAPGAVLHPFCRIAGASTRIDAGARIGEAGAAVIQDSQVGAGAVVGNLGPVTLRGSAVGPGAVLGCGVAEQAVFLGREGDAPDFTTGYGFRVRKGSLYEEGANSAQHTDTKMTVLFPWVTLGSNINGCDLLVAGGTGPRVGEFSEIGSGVIHFNFTPRGDKATASLLGDVAQGVFLRSRRLFIGGNASLIGPLHADYGAVAAAGGRFSGELGAGLHPGAPPPQADADFDLEVYGAVHRAFASQVRAIAALAALEAWYAHVRARLAAGDAARAALYGRGRAMVRLNLAERIAQLGGLAGRMERSAALLERRTPGDPRIAQQRALLEHWPEIETHLAGCQNVQTPPPAALLEALEEATGTQGGVYTRAVQALPPEAVRAGQDWLREIEGAVAHPSVLARVPALERAG
jgi:UDP-N-acetylglucosamine/UDP-N-acetylgalactosamine diphosphorylase